MLVEGLELSNSDESDLGARVGAWFHGESDELRLVGGATVGENGGRVRNGEIHSTEADGFSWSRSAGQLRSVSSCGYNHRVPRSRWYVDKGVHWLVAGVSASALIWFVFAVPSPVTDFPTAGTPRAFRDSCLGPTFRASGVLEVAELALGLALGLAFALGCAFSTAFVGTGEWFLLSHG